MSSTAQTCFHWVEGRVIVNFDGEVVEVGWSSESQKGVLLVGEVLGEQVGRTVESVDHAANIL